MNLAVLENRRDARTTSVTEAVLRELSRYDCTVQRCSRVGQVTLPCDCALVLVGDGTILRAAKALSSQKIPVLGINLGRVGYLAEIEPNELSLLSCLFFGKTRIEGRMMLEVTVKDQKLTALNDVVIANRGASRLVEIGACHNGTGIGSYLADGLIVATPTGSTAYSMSAGGSVLDPTLECLSLTPICPIHAYAKPLIFSAQSVLSFCNLASDETALSLTLDGIAVGQLAPEEEVVVSLSEERAYFLHVKQDSFCNTLRNKVLITGSREL